MQPTRRVSNPFAMMVDPEAVLARIAHSERLSRLQGRICRPLDKPLLPGAAASTEDAAAYDGEIDAAPEEPVEDAVEGAVDEASNAAMQVLANWASDNRTA